jgi:hypothetical protein
MRTHSNIAFTILIKIEGRLKEFNFRKRAENLYDGNTNDEYSIRYYFQLKKEDGAADWKINGQSLPGWITKNETTVSEALEKEPQ